MDMSNKGKSPFYPGQPVPIEFFIGRINEINRVIRALGQINLGKPQYIFLSGEYGIGKSSFAGFIRDYAEKNSILGVHVLLGGSSTLEDVATRTVKSVIESHAYEHAYFEKIRNLLAKYIGKQDLFGLSINLEVLKADGPGISQGYLPFLRQLFERLNETGIKGIMLILDEINGITASPDFAHFLKGLVDENALSKNPLPLLLMLCGTDERRREMIQQHQPIERIFDVVEVKPMNDAEMVDFFTKTFGSVGMKVNPETLTHLCHYSEGFPKLMHIIGDTIFWMDQDGIIDNDDAIDGIMVSAEDIGKKFVDPQVYNALWSKDYRSILAKLAKEKFDLSFLKSNVEEGLSTTEKKKFNNFLQRMKKLNVLRSGGESGEYVFNSRLVQLYIRLKSLKKSIQGG